MAPRPQTLAARFWPKVDKDGPVPAHRAELGPCWVWRSGIDISGYGRIRRAGKGSRGDKAHRVMWELVIGLVPAGLLVLHRCDNRRCVRPDHLFLGSQKDNADDAVSKGRWLRGERSPNAKLSNRDVIEVKRRLAAEERQRDVAASFGVSQHLISLISQGKHRASE